MNPLEAFSAALQRSIAQNPQGALADLNTLYQGVLSGAQPDSGAISRGMDRALQFGPLAIKTWPGMSLQQLQAALQSEYAPRAQVVLKPRGGLNLNDLNVAQPFRSQGLGSEIMGDLTGYADKNRVPMNLIPYSAQGEVPEGVLRQFYGKFGFQPNPEFPLQMIRPPQ